VRGLEKNYKKERAVPIVDYEREGRPARNVVRGRRSGSRRSTEAIPPEQRLTKVGERSLER